MFPAGHTSSPIGDTQIVAYRRQRQRHKDKDTKTTDLTSRS